jgi:hypothetical protein
LLSKGPEVCWQKVPCIAIAIGEGTEYVVGARSCHSSMLHPRPEFMVLFSLSLCCLCPASSLLLAASYLSSTHTESETSEQDPHTQKCGASTTHCWPLWHLYTAWLPNRLQRVPRHLLRPSWLDIIHIHSTLTT